MRILSQHYRVTIDGDVPPIGTMVFDDEQIVGFLYKRRKLEHNAAECEFVFFESRPISMDDPADNITAQISDWTVPFDEVFRTLDADFQRDWLEVMEAASRRLNLEIRTGKLKYLAKHRNNDQN